MMDKKLYTRLTSRAHHDALKKVLALCATATTNRDTTAAHARLRDLLEKIFTYKCVAVLPDDAMVEMAEVLEGIYEERNDLEGYYEHMIGYLQRKKKDYVNTREKYDNIMHLNTFSAKKSELHKLDDTFNVWLYTEGYYAQRADMYDLLLDLIHNMISYENSK